MDSDVRRLRCFLILAEELHFGRAAARLSVSASAVTQQINRLERELGHRLFFRTSRTVHLSAEGQALIPLARDMVTANDRLSAWVDETRPATAQLRIGTTATAPGPLMRPIVSRLSAEIEGDVVLRDYTHDTALVALRRHEVDAVYAREPVSSAGVRRMPLFQEARVAVVPSSHPLADRITVVMYDLAGETLLPIAGGSPEWMDFWLGDALADGREPKVAPSVSGFDEMQEACAAGAGVGIAPALVGRVDPDPRLRYIPIVDLGPTRVVLCTCTGADHPALRALERISRRVVAALSRRPNPPAGRPLASPAK